MTLRANGVALDAARWSAVLQIGEADFCNGYPHVGARFRQLLRVDGVAILLSCFLVDPRRDIDISPDLLPLLDFGMAHLFCVDADLGLNLGVYCYWFQSF